MDSYRPSNVDLQVVIVLPYLNEQDTLFDSCRSLGFGTGAETTPPQATLILVDNGSTDGSPEIAKNIKEDSREASVILGYETEPGYVPPRRRGNLIAREMAEAKGWDEKDVLVLQADADARYEKGYIESMRSAAANAGSNALIEGCLSYPSDFKATHYKYLEMCRQADFPFEKLFVDEGDDVLVVDCVSGYRLADYVKWGEHQREYTLNGDELYAETTRLYIKARASGARRIRVETTGAFHSPRKVFIDPALHFATAGFPREISWVKKWRHDYHGPKTLVDFYEQTADPDVEKAIRVRQMHIIALLVILPWQVNWALGRSIDTQIDDWLILALSNLPQRTVEGLQKTPGHIITDIFRLVEMQGDILIKASQETKG